MISFENEVKLTKPAPILASNASLLNRNGSPVPKKPNDKPTAFRLPANDNCHYFTNVVIVLGIFFSYLCFGFIQENISKKHFAALPKENDSDKFKAVGFLIFAQNIGNCIVATIMLKLFNQNILVGQKNNFWMKSLMSLSYLAAMLLSNKAISYIDYTTQVLVKSSKMIPLLFFNILLSKHHKHTSREKIFSVTVITIGVSVFTLEKVTDSTQLLSGDRPLFGLSMLVVSLLCDGITGTLQDILLSRNENPIQLMLSANMISSIVTFFGVIITGEFSSALSFFSVYPEAILHVVLFGAVGAVGQLFIYLALHSIGSISVSIVTTCRKFCTIVFSVFMFGNSLSVKQWMCCFVVFSAIFFDMFYHKYKKRKATLKAKTKSQEKSNKKENENENEKESEEEISEIREHSSASSSSVFSPPPFNKMRLSNTPWIVESPSISKKKKNAKAVKSKRN